MSQNFRNNKPLPKYLTDRKLKISALFIFEIKRQKGQNFQFFKWLFLRNGCPYGYDFWLVFRYLCEASKKYNFAIFSRYSKNFINLNVKSCLKLNGP